MKVLAINGSPRKNGNVTEAFNIMIEELNKEGIDVEVLEVGAKAIQGCLACYYCKKDSNNLCAQTNDEVNDTVKKFQEADGILLGSPNYFGGMAGTLKCFLDRLFFVSYGRTKYKVASAICTTRRAGGVDVVHELNNYFKLTDCIVAPSKYWPIALGLKKGAILQDEEGIQTLKKNAKNMAWLLKSLNYSKEKFPVPE